MKQYAEFLRNYLHHMSLLIMKYCITAEHCFSHTFQMCSANHLRNKL